MSQKPHHFSTILSFCLSLFTCLPLYAREADLILFNGKIVTVDKDFKVTDAIAINDGRVIQVGTKEAVFKLGGPSTRKIDLKGKMILPGLIDSHTHPTSAAMFEFDHSVPEMRSIDDVLKYVAQRAKFLDDGEWIVVNQVFITRLKERRFPSKAELDQAAPKNPVLFRTGPDGVINSQALKLSGIDKTFKSEGKGIVERDKTGQPTGMLRNCLNLVRSQPPKSNRVPKSEDRKKRLLQLFADYNAVGITSIADRNASKSAVDQYHRLLKNKTLNLRVAASRGISTAGNVKAIQFAIDKIAQDTRVRGKKDATDMLQIVGVKIFLDGGMLTGSARMREPWGLSSIYSIDDASYKGLFRTDPKKLAPIIEHAAKHKLQFTAHSVGDGAVHALLDAYQIANKTYPMKELRACITHSNFMSEEAINQMAKLGVVADIQPAWLWMDGATLKKQFGNDRLRWFQPLKSIFAKDVIVGGGSDHMQKVGSLRAVNPYNPFLGMWITIARQLRDSEDKLHVEEALTRKQALAMYTINNAYLLFLDDKVGSLEPGKYADMIEIDRDLLTCPVGDIKTIQVNRTWLEGKEVFKKAAE